MSDHIEQYDPLESIFRGLGNKNADVRLQNAIELRNYVATTVAEMSPDIAGKVWDNVNQGIFDLMHSQHNEKKLGGLIAMNLLLQIDGEETLDSKRNLFRFYNYVKHLLPDPDVNLMLLASQTLGKIVHAASKSINHVSSAGGAFNESFMDHQVPAAINLIQPDKLESSRYAGVLILKELARNSPVYFYAHIGLVFANILVPLRDQRVIVREAAAELLAACLEIIAERERPTKSPYLANILRDAQLGLRQAQPEIIHASLLAYRELLNRGGMFMRDVFSDTAEQILRFRSHRDNLIRKLVMNLIPSLAAYDTQTFSELYLKKTMAHLSSVLDKPNDRQTAFIAIGHTATFVKSDIKPYLDSTMQQIKQGLQVQKRKNVESEGPIFQCIAMLAAAVGPALTKWLHDVLELMFNCGLSEPLHGALVAIATNIPPFLKHIQSRLLSVLSVTLSGKEYNPVGAPLPTRRSIDSDNSPALEVVPSEKNPELIKLALAILGSFDFSGHILNEFVRSCALPYLENDSPAIRRTAAETCCRLFVRDPIFYSSSSHAIQVISDVLNKLLTVGIADPDASIRKAVLSSLHSGFDKHLAQAENVRSLFIALNDEVFENRVAAVTLIGRLSKNNPAYVVPSLRKTLIQLLTELEYSNVKRSREECTSLLTMLVNVTQNFMKPYALPILAALMLKAHDSNPAVAANIMMCLGALTVVAGEDATPYVPQLMGVIITQLSDPSLVKRDAALHTLGQLCSSTGYVIAPLVDHPQLLQLLGRILRTETTLIVQREVVKVLGIIGALDPYRRKSKSDESGSSEIAMTAVNQVALNQPSTVASDDQFQTVVMSSLLAILRDPSLSNHYHTVIEAIMSIFKTQGLKCVSFLPQVIPAFAAVTRSSPARLQEFHLQQLSILVGIIKQHVRNYTMSVFGLIKELWDNTTLQLPLVSLIEALGNALAADFKPLLPTVIPLILRAFDNEFSPKRAQTQIKIFDALQTFGSILEEYLYLVIPVIVKTYERVDATTALRKRAMQTIDGLTKHVYLADHASRIIHPLARVLNGANNELRVTVLDTLCSLVVQLGSDFAVFVPMINQCLLRTKMAHPRYEGLVKKLLNGERLSNNVMELILNESAKTPEFSAPAEATKLIVNQVHLRTAWDTSLVTTVADWTEWMRRVRLEFMKESPSHALRACMSLVDAHPPLARELFNAAFLSCWTELYDQYQEELVAALESALESRIASDDIIHSILDLAEFMEHQEKPLPIEHSTLGEHALHYSAYAKALHYKELQFFADSSPATIEALISINTRLQQHDAAWGTLVTARENYDIIEHAEWYEKLGRWQEALIAYDKKAQEYAPSMETEIGRMKCLHALGEWDQLAVQVERCWGDANAEHRGLIAPMATAAAWSLADWESMDAYIAQMKQDSSDRHFYKAIMAVHQNNFPRALFHIAKTRDLLLPELTSFVGDGYGRAYNVMVRAQLLSELDEIIQYKKSADQPERQKTMRKTWMKRLQGCQPDVEVWQRILQVRTLVINPETDPEMWIRFSNLCRSSERMALAEKTINSLLSPVRPNSARAPPDVVYCQLKFMWANNAQEESLDFLRQFTNSLVADLGVEASKETDPRTGASKPRVTRLSKLLARCYYKLGEWEASLQPDWASQQHYKNILNSYLFATHYDGEWYKAWHTWALANFEVISYLKAHDRTVDIVGNRLAAHAVQAITGFFRSISLRNEEALQDTLRLLTLWFEFGAHDDVSQAINNGFRIVEVDTWLEVIPQIIARIQTPHVHIRRDINNILLDVGKNHPQALIYPLVVASASSSKTRQSAAYAIMGVMKEHSRTIVEQAEIVSAELIRVAILWHERWHEGLEEASRLYFTEKNADGMIAVLQPLHDLLDRGPETARETSFATVFGRELREARDACRRYRTYGETNELDKAWDIYYAVFKKVEKQLPQLTTLDLQYVSPRLLKARDLDLAVPGTYRSGHPVVQIQRFSPKLTVIASKQRPRRLSLTGSDGRDYQYVLKGHEDLRQDERVMQLFSLVNTLLSVDTPSFKRRLHIQRYPVIPLAPNAGLLGWVQDSDTLHVLVRDHREARKVVLNIEYRMIIQVFEYALENTTGQDLYRVLWLKSTNSEHWLERRATYTRSLAVNSMVGHILGLGDRHPSNLLLQRETGKVIHIDFGDCFEIAMHREKFPEKIPFRLTRMLTHAMEVSGIEGSYRNTCEITMRVLRDNKESLMAVLEAFIYDPLMNWRLTQPSPEMRRTDSDPTRVADLARVPQGPTRKLKADENYIFSEGGANAGAQEVRNVKALSVYNRVQNKLTGRDFDPEIVLPVNAQVERLIQQATSIENLCQCFSGWCAFW
ncbi:phosphatidylinositol 3-kinase [Mycena crocata]|nr:phosphatidylinositol 3-kinase [Mycena crocata]